MKAVRHIARHAAWSVLFAATAALAQQQPLKIGLVLPLSGPYASYGLQIGNGVKLYLTKNGDTIAGRKVELIIRDDTGGAPEVTKRVATELVTRDKVDVLAGFGLTPGAVATAAVATQAKKPMIVMNAATQGLTLKSPYIVRTSHSQPQLSEPIGTWAAKNGIDKAYTLVADYAPGIDAAAAFKKTFTAAGKQLEGELRVPLQSPDFGPYIQRVKDAKPQGVFVFLPPGDAPIALMKAWSERGLDQLGIKLLGTGDLVDESVVDAAGKAALGTITSGEYSTAHDSPQNKEFVAAYEKAYHIRPTYMAVAGYDGIAVMAAALKKTNGDADGDKFMAAVKGLSLDSPRGPIRIDPDTRDIVQTVYIRRTELVNGKAEPVEIDKFPAVRDPGK